MRGSLIPHKVFLFEVPFNGSIVHFECINLSWLMKDFVIILEIQEKFLIWKTLREFAA